MKKITDKIRLNWLQKNEQEPCLLSVSNQWHVQGTTANSGYIRKTLRAAIDAAITAAHRTAKQGG